MKRFAAWCIVLTLALCAQAGEINKSFKGVKQVRIRTISGDCTVKAGTGSEVKVVVNYTYDDDDIDFEIEQSGSRLSLREDFINRPGRGESRWTVTVPRETDIEFSTASGNGEFAGLHGTFEAKTASGDLRLDNIAGDIDAGTASGEVDAQNLSGEIEIGTASGNVTIDGLKGDGEVGTASGDIRASAIDGEFEIGAASGDVDIRSGKGKFEVGAASGDVTAREVILTAASEFSAASGDVELRLAETARYDLQVRAASGDAVLNYGGNAIQGRIEMTATTDRGRIQAPFKFDSEETYYRGRDEYVTKTTQKGSGPRIQISSASGLAALNEK